ncbi:hypothetical protein D3C80_1625130 [compost metagenome]
MELPDRFAAGVLDRIGHGEQRQRARGVEQQHHGLALFFQGEEFFFQSWRAQAQLLHQTVVAQVVELTVDFATHTPPGQCLEVIHSAQGELLIHSRIGNGQRYRVVGTPSQAGG